jgi:hypothetical protein
MSKSTETYYGATVIECDCKFMSPDGKPVRYGDALYFNVGNVMVELGLIETGDDPIYNTHVYSYNAGSLNDLGIDPSGNYEENFFDPVAMANIFSDYYHQFPNQRIQGRLQYTSQYKDRLTEAIIDQATHNIYGKDLGGMPLTSV